MDTNNSRFLYTIENITLYTPSIIECIIGICIMLCIAISIRYFFLYSRTYVIMKKEERAIEKKKHILGDLILMKDIQTELEAEIERSMLKSTFQ